MNLITVHNIEEYNKAIERCVPSDRYFNKNATIISWILRDPFEFNNKEIRNIFGTNVCICDEALELLGKSVIYCGHEIGILKGVEITEEDFYWVIYNIAKEKEVFLSCVGRLDYLDPELLRRSEEYGKVEASNPTQPNIAFIMGGIWREQNPTKETIKRVLELAWTYREDCDQTEIEYIMKNYNKNENTNTR